MRDARRLEWELGIPAPDESIHLHSPASHGLDECTLGVWLLALMLGISCFVAEAVPDKHVIVGNNLYESIPAGR